MRKFVYSYAKNDSRFLSNTSYNDKLKMQQDWHSWPETMKPLKRKYGGILLDTVMGENLLTQALKPQWELNGLLGFQETKSPLAD